MLALAASQGDSWESRATCAGLLTRIGARRAGFFGIGFGTSVGAKRLFGDALVLGLLRHRRKDRPAGLDEAANLVERKRGAVVAVYPFHRPRHAHRVQDRFLG